MTTLNTNYNSLVKMLKRNNIMRKEPSKRNRRDVLSIINDISFIVEYEELGTKSHSKLVEKRTDELRKIFFVTIGHNIDHYSNVSYQIIEGEKYAEFVRDEHEINNIFTFIASLYEYEFGGVAVYMPEDIEKFKVYPKTSEGDHWSICSTYLYTITHDKDKDGTYTVLKEVSGLIETEIIRVRFNSRTGYVTLASAIFDLYNRFVGKAYVRINAIWGFSDNHEEALEYLRNKLKRYSE